MRVFFLRLSDSDFSKVGNVWTSTATLDLYDNATYRNYSTTRSIYGLDNLGDGTWTGLRLVAANTTDTGKLSSGRYVDTSGRIDIVSYALDISGASGAGVITPHLTVYTSGTNSPYLEEFGAAGPFTPAETIDLVDAARYVRFKLDFDAITTFSATCYIRVEIDVPVMAPRYRATRRVLDNFPEWTAIREFERPEDQATPSLATPTSVGGKVLNAMAGEWLDDLTSGITKADFSRYVETADLAQAAWCWRSEGGVPQYLYSITGDGVQLARAADLNEFYAGADTDHLCWWDENSDALFTRRQYTTLLLNGVAEGQQAHHVWNAFDDLGLSVDLYRLHSEGATPVHESNENFRHRILDVHRNKPGVGFESFKLAVRRELNIWSVYGSTPDSAYLGATPEVLEVSDLEDDALYVDPDGMPTRRFTELAERLSREYPTTWGRFRWDKAYYDLGGAKHEGYAVLPYRLDATPLSVADTDPGVGDGTDLFLFRPDAVTGAHDFTARLKLRGRAKTERDEYPPVEFEFEIYGASDRKIYNNLPKSVWFTVEVTTTDAKVWFHSFLLSSTSDVDVDQAVPSGASFGVYQVFADDGSGTNPSLTFSDKLGDFDYQDHAGAIPAYEITSAKLRFGKWDVEGQVYGLIGSPNNSDDWEAWFSHDPTTVLLYNTAEGSCPTMEGGAASATPSVVMNTPSVVLKSKDVSFTTPSGGWTSERFPYTIAINTAVPNTSPLPVTVPIPAILWDPYQESTPNRKIIVELKTKDFAGVFGAQTNDEAGIPIFLPADPYLVAGGDATWTDGKKTFSGALPTSVTFSSGTGAAYPLTATIWSLFEANQTTPFEGVVDEYGPWRNGTAASIGNTNFVLTTAENTSGGVLRRDEFTIVGGSAIPNTDDYVVTWMGVEVLDDPRVITWLDTNTVQSFDAPFVDAAVPPRFIQELFAANLYSFEPFVIRARLRLGASPEWNPLIHSGWYFQGGDERYLFAEPVTQTVSGANATLTLAGVARQGAPILVHTNEATPRQLRQVAFFGDATPTTLSLVCKQTVEGTGIDKLYLAHSDIWAATVTDLTTGASVAITSTTSSTNILMTTAVTDREHKYEVSYKLARSFYADHELYPSGVHRTTLTFDKTPTAFGVSGYDVVYEGSRFDPATPVDLPLNPLVTSLNEGFVFLSQTTYGLDRAELSISPSKLVADGEDYLILSLRSLDSYGNPKPNQSFTLVTTFGTFDNATQTKNVTTDDSGFVQVVLTSSTLVASTGTVTVSGGASVEGTFEVEPAVRGEFRLLAAPAAEQMPADGVAENLIFGRVETPRFLGYPYATVRWKRARSLYGLFIAASEAAATPPSQTTVTVTYDSTPGTPPTPTPAPIQGGDSATAPGAGNPSYNPLVGKYSTHAMDKIVLTKPSTTQAGDLMLVALAGDIVDSVAGQTAVVTDWGRHDTSASGYQGETSGVCSSQLGGTWAIRDSGNPASIYWHTETSRGHWTWHEVPVTGATNADWEDCFYTPGFVWVHENRGNESTNAKRLYKVNEPTSPGTATAATLAATYYWQFPSTASTNTCAGQFNCEAVAIYDGMIYAVQKKTGSADVYRIGAPGSLSTDPNNPTIGVRVGSINHGCPSSFAISADNTMVITVSHGHVKVWRRGAATTIESFLDGQNRLIFDDVPPSVDTNSTNIESATWWPHQSTSFVAVSESKTTYDYDAVSTGTTGAVAAFTPAPGWTLARADAVDNNNAGIGRIALRPSTEIGPTGASTTTPAFSVPAQTLVVLAVCFGYSAGGPSQPSNLTDTLGGLDWTYVNSGAVGDVGGVVYWAWAPTAVTGTVTLTWGANTDAAIYQIDGFTGVDNTVGTHGVVTSNAIVANTAAPTVGLGHSSPLRPGSVLYGFLNHNSEDNIISAGAGFTLLGTGATVAIPSQQQAVAWNTSPASPTVNFSCSGAANSYVQLLEIAPRPVTGDLGLRTYWRTATSSEPASYTFDQAGATARMTGALLVYRGLTLKNVSAGSISAVNEVGLVPVAPTVTTTEDNSFLVCFFATAAGAGVGWDEPTQAVMRPQVERYTDPAYNVLICDEQRYVAGATGVRSAEFDGSAAANGAQTLILKPALVTSTTTTDHFISPEAAPTSRGCMHGFYSGGNQGGSPGMEADQTELGKDFAVGRYYAQWQLPGSNAEGQIDARLVLISHKPPGSSDGVSGWGRIANGSEDAMIDALATWYKAKSEAIGHDIVFIFHHEPHDDASDIKGGSAGTSTEYKVAWRRIVERFRSKGATKIKFGYSAVGSHMLAATDKCWPGADLIDVLCPDSYNWGSYKGGWDEFEIDYAPLVQLAKVLNKPIIVGEFGSHPSEDGHTRNAYFTNAATWIKTDPDASRYIIGFCYFHVDSHDGSGHMWRFTADANQADDGKAGWITGFVNDAYFTATPFPISVNPPAPAEDTTTVVVVQPPPPNPDAPDPDPDEPPAATPNPAYQVPPTVINTTQTTTTINFSPQAFEGMVVADAQGRFVIGPFKSSGPADTGYWFAMAEVSGIGYDTFHRDDGAFSAADSGQTWTHVISSFAVEGQQAAPQATTAMSVVDVSDADVSVELVLDDSGPDVDGTTKIGPVVRYSDANNYYWVTHSSRAAFQIRKRVAGVDSNVGTSYTPSPVLLADSRYTVRLEAQGTSLRLYVNGVLVKTVTDTSLSSGTKVGMRNDGGDVDARVDSILVGALDITDGLAGDVVFWHEYPDTLYGVQPFTGLPRASVQEINTAPATPHALLRQFPSNYDEAVPDAPDVDVYSANYNWLPPRWYALTKYYQYQLGLFGDTRRAVTVDPSVVRKYRKVI